MKRINNRGVVLLETLIVSIFVLTIFVFVYRNSVPMMGQYQKLEKFDDIDSVYAANLVKNMVITYIPENYIEDTLLATASYADISNCDDSNLYTDANYCKKVKENLNIGSTDIMYITRYNASDMNDFKNDIKSSKMDSLFVGGELGDFRDYLKTVSNSESFYDPANNTNKVVGVYRVFISRTVSKMDGTTMKKYANIGIYKSNYNNG